MLKNLFLALFVATAIACSASPRVNLNDEEGNTLKPSARQGVVAKELVKLMEKAHYKEVPFNDSLSAVIYENYIDALDMGKNYFLKSDVQEFDQYRGTLLSDLENGDLSAMFHIYNVYRNRYLQHLTHAQSLLESEFDFTEKEKFIYNREDEEWFANEEEAQDAWRKRVKYDLLNLRLSSTGDEGEGQKRLETLKQRYQDLINQMKKANNYDAFQEMMNALTGAIDPHTNYFNPERAQDFNEAMSRSFEGIGALLQMDNEVVKIMSIVPGGPAFRDKTLKPDDRIIAVAQGADGDFVDVIGWRLQSVVSKIKGPKGTVVRLKVIPSGQQLSSTPNVVSLVRDKIVNEEGSAKKQIKEVKGEDGHTYKIGLITVPGFYLDFEAMRRGDTAYKSTTRDVRLILDTLKKENVDGVLLDLRGNGGGSLIEAVELTGLFIDEGPVVQVRDPQDRIEVSNDENPGVSWDGPLGIMLDRVSASASEIFAGAIQDYGRGIILGSQSYGKGTVQSAVPMDQFIGRAERLKLRARADGDGADEESTPQGAPEFGQINFTTYKFYRVNGSSTQHKGVLPDISFPSIYPIDKFGESSEKAALPWDQIETTAYTSWSDLSQVTPKLEAAHMQRMESSPEYTYLLEDIELLNKRQQESAVSLNESELKKEREALEAKNLARVNARRALKGEPLLKKGDTIPRTEDDFIRDESLNVMVDFINSSKK